MMRKPYPDSPFARLLALLYAKAVSVRNACFDHAPGASMAFNTPVISVGGIHAGGTGKTPLSILIGQYYSRKGIQVACLSRGYRRQSRRRIIVTPGETVSWERIGDEPAMIRREIPECLLGIGADRCATLAALQDRLRPPSAVILDDGFQYRRLRRDIDIVCLPPLPFGERCFPAGYLREPLENITRADAVCVIGAGDEVDLLRKTRARLIKTFGLGNVFLLIQEPGQWENLSTGEKRMDLPLESPLLVAGIARPERFVALVKSRGVVPSGEYFFPDHHPVSARELESLAAGRRRGIITTAKDAEKMRNKPLVNSYDIWYFTIYLKFVDLPSAEDFYTMVYKPFSKEASG